jgi:pantetheine-phosphate adenylyltransferase
MRPYRKVWTGGTFDHLHEGHKELLAAAFAAGDHVVIGLLADDRVRGKAFAELIQPEGERRRILEAYLADTYGTERFTVLLQGDVMCYKTGEHFHAINAHREAAGLRPLEWVDSPSEFRGRLSSTMIRERLRREETGKGRG